MLTLSVEARQWNSTLREHGLQNGISSRYGNLEDYEEDGSEVSIGVMIH